MAKNVFKVRHEGSRNPAFADLFIALVRKRLYKMILTGDIREGTYILAKEYVLARADRINGEGEVLSVVSNLGFTTHSDIL